MARILIVDDEEMDRILLAKVLQPDGHELLFAPNAEVALRICRNSRVDVVVTDIVMPGLNGLELLETLISEDPGARIIAISGISAKKLNKARRSGARAVLTKPVNAQELLEEIERAIED